MSELDQRRRNRMPSLSWRSSMSHGQPITRASATRGRAQRCDRPGRRARHRARTPRGTNRGAAAARTVAPRGLERGHAEGHRGNGSGSGRVARSARREFKLAARDNFARPRHFASTSHSQSSRAWSRPKPSALNSSSLGEIRAQGSGARKSDRGFLNPKADQHLARQWKTFRCGTMRISRPAMRASKRRLLVQSSLAGSLRADPHPPFSKSKSTRQASLRKVKKNGPRKARC